MKLVAVGRIPRSDRHYVMFYYEVDGRRDMTMPTWEIPVNNFEHMQAVVYAFNERG